MSFVATASTEFLHLLALAIADTGLTPTDVVASAGLTQQALATRGARIPIGAIRAAWDRAAALTGNPALGLQCAARLEFGALDVLDYLVGASQNCGEAFARFVKFLPLLSNAGDISFSVGPQRAHLRHFARDANPQISELFLALVVQRGRHVFGPDFRPLSVSFMHARSGAAAAYDAAFGGQVKFAQPINELVFDRAQLAMTGRQPDPTLVAILEAQAAFALHALPLPSEGGGRDDFLLAVRRLLQGGLATGDFSLTMLADRMEMSVRSIQRHLRQLGLSHRNLVQEVRTQSAQQAVATDVGTKEISRVLGYSSPTAFHRAFKRWNGTTPGQARLRRKLGNA